VHGVRAVLIRVSVVVCSVIHPLAQLGDVLIVHRFQVLSSRVVNTFRIRGELGKRTSSF